jgi:hypothetical protein
MARKILHSFRIDEISGVDKPAQEHATVALFKRDDNPTIKRFNASGEGPAHDRLLALYDNAKRGNPQLTSAANFAAAWNQLSDAERDQIRSEEAVVAAAIAAEDEARRRKLTQSSTETEDLNKMTKSELLLATKSAGVIAKSMIETGNPGITEREFTKIVHDEAQKGRRDGETPEQAFARYFNDPGNRELRQAYQLTKYL